MQHATGDTRPELSRLLDSGRIAALQDVVRKIPVAEHLFAYARDLARATRPGEANAPAYIKDYVQWGAGPRAGIYLILAAKARAVLHGRAHVTSQDIVAVAHPVLRHRIITTFAAESAAVNADAIVDRLLKDVQPN